LVSVPAGNGVAAFRIGRTEVTNAQYAQCVADGACTVPSATLSYYNPLYAEHPVVAVSRTQARAYASWVGGSLPTEAQWTRACQGDDGRTYPWGNQMPDATLANYNSIVGDTTAVGSYPTGASPYGALDMVGNVWEWVEDGSWVIRGGGFVEVIDYVRCGARLELFGFNSGSVGVRVVSPGP
jgi:formylglycine-generating enzyme required for sulfatase activity